MDTRRTSYHHIVFFFNDTATTEIYTLSLHDALPISGTPFLVKDLGAAMAGVPDTWGSRALRAHIPRSEEHTSELQSRPHLVCRLLLEKKKTATTGNRASSPQS